MRAPPSEAGSCFDVSKFKEMGISSIRHSGFFIDGGVRHGFLSPTCAISDAVASFSDSSVLPPSRSIMLVSNLSWPNSRLLTNRLRTLAISGSPSERAASAETLISVSLYSGDGRASGDAQRGIDGHVRQLQLNAWHTPGTPGASNQHQVTRRSTSKSLSYLGVCGASLC